MEDAEIDAVLAEARAAMKAGILPRFEERFTWIGNKNLIGHEIHSFSDPGDDLRVLVIPVEQLPLRTSTK